jgi:hypothetical protein
MTIRQTIIYDNLSETDFCDIFNQFDFSNEEALFITDEHEPIAIGKDNTFKVIFQVELANCIQTNCSYKCNKHQSCKMFKWTPV